MMTLRLAPVAAEASLIDGIGSWLTRIGWSPGTMNAGQWISLGIIVVGGLVFGLAMVRGLRGRRAAKTDRPRPWIEPASSAAADVPSTRSTRLAVPSPQRTVDRHESERGEAPPGVAFDVQRLTRELMAELDGKIHTLQLLIAKADERIRTLDWQGWPEADANAHATDESAGPKPARRGPEAVLRQEATDPTTRQIYALADEGMPIIEIARRTGQATGKIELILALRGR